MNETETDNVVKCKELCETTVLCSHFIWDKTFCKMRKGTVHLSDAIKKSKKEGFKCGIGFKKKITLTVKTEQVKNTLFNGKSLGERETSSADECNDICRNEIKNCQSISFVESSKQCLFFDKENPTRMQSEGHISIRNKGFNEKNNKKNIDK